MVYRIRNHRYLGGLFVLVVMGPPVAVFYWSVLTNDDQLNMMAVSFMIVVLFVGSVLMLIDIVRIKRRLDK